MKPIDRIMKKEVPGYSYIAKGVGRAVSAAREPKTPRQKKPVQLTEIGKSGKAVLRKGVTVTPQGVFDLIERAHNLERRVEKLENW